MPPKRCRIIAVGEPNAILVVARSGLAVDATRVPCPRAANDRRTHWEPIRRPAAVSLLTRYRPVSVEYLVRVARITDVDRLVVLGQMALEPASLGLEPVPMSGGDGPTVAADLLRQLVYLPQASIVVVEEGRDLVGGGVLALRPSVRAGGFIGTVDLLMVDPRHDIERITEVLLEELLRSARNKGCSVVEAIRPQDLDSRNRWERLGFVGSAPIIERAVALDRTAAR